MKTVKYRIKEYRGVFIIQIYSYEKKGFLWWKRKEWSWRNTNAWGGVWEPWPIYQPFSRTFKSLDKAQQQIKDWQTDPFYHNFYQFSNNGIKDHKKVLHQINSLAPKKSGGNIPCLRSQEG